MAQKIIVGLLIVIAGLAGYSMWQQSSASAARENEKQETERIAESQRVVPKAMRDITNELVAFQLRAGGLGEEELNGRLPEGQVESLRRAERWEAAGKRGRYPGSLADLRGQRALRAQERIGEAGYILEYEASRMGEPSYSLRAAPRVLKPGRLRCFFVDQSGIIRFNAGDEKASAADRPI